MMEQLLGMGFSHELAAQALAATGGKSTLRATEWILNQKSSPHSTTTATATTATTTTTTIPPPPPQHSPPVQPSLDRYFISKPPPPPGPPPTSSDTTNTDHSPPPSNNPNKRPRKTPIVSEPLPERMRPRSIDEVVGQDHLLGPNSVLRSALDRGLLPSLVLWGPPGTGKTSIARALANSSSSSSSSSYRFVSLSAVTAGVKDVRDAIEEARRLLKGRGTLAPPPTRTVLFVDEVHRFSRSQQDAFLPAIEDGSIVFVGATTENPSFHLTTPLLSRCRVLALEPLQPHHVAALIRRAVQDIQKGVALSIRNAQNSVALEEDAVEFLSLHCDGDARVALNALEVSATLAFDRKPDDGNEIFVTLADVKESLQRKHLAYDRAGEEHYNLISALHKSMRGGDADAAIYWLARMLEGGEQPLYIARRLVRFASEDVGLADPSALGLAVACYQACHFLGMPECNVNLAQCVAYLALAPKSVAVYRAIEAAQRLVRESVGGNEGVPLHLRNAPTKLMKEFGYGKGYLYPPDHPDCSLQTYLPPSLLGHKFLDWPPPPEDKQT